MKYRTYLERMEEARISEEMNRKRMANVSVIQPAEVPRSRSRRRRKEHPAGDAPRRGDRPRGRLLLRIHVGEFFTPGTAGKQLALPVLTTIRHRD